MNTKLAVAVLGVLMQSSVQAVSVFMPTDGTVNFIEFFGTSSALIGIFDDSDVSFTGSFLSILASGDQATFTASGADYSLVNSSGTGSNTFTLSGSNYFTLALWKPGMGIWAAPDAVTCLPLSGSCSVAWAGQVVELVVDLVEAPPITTVPIPASATLLGAGAFGLVAVARRRTASNKSAAT